MLEQNSCLFSHNYAVDLIISYCRGGVVLPCVTKPNPIGAPARLGCNEEGYRKTKLPLNDIGLLIKTAMHRSFPRSNRCAIRRKCGNSISDTRISFYVYA